MRHITDPQDEPFDVLDADGQPTGIVKPRGEVHRDGDWHRGLHIWVYGFDEDDRPYVLFQRRSQGKDTWPGALDVTVGGHYRAGETLEDTLRETEEEIGLAARTDELVTLGQRFADAHGPGYIDRELNDVYALRCDLPLAEFRLHPEEVDGIVAVDLEHAIALFDGSAVSIPVRETGLDGIEHRITVTLGNFVHTDDGYGPAALEGIRILATGNEPEPFNIR